MFLYAGSGDLGGFIFAIIIFIILVRLSTRVGYGSRRNYSNRNRWRGGMFGPGFWYGNSGRPPFNNNNQYYNPYSNSNDPNNQPNDPNNPYMNNNPANGSFQSPPPYGYNDPFANRVNNNYTPPTYVPPGAQPNSNFSWPTPVENVVSAPPTNNSSNHNANNAVHSWQMPDNQVVLREVFVWARSVAGWHYAGKLLVDGGMSKAEIQGYAQGKFGVPENDLLCIEAPSFEDAQRTFRTYHPDN